jgi:predicted enzyme related to lactoylglutathione lyase
MQLSKTIPVLPSQDLERSVAFYKRVFGFEANLYPDYVVLHRNDVEIHLWLCTDRHIAENSSCYIHVQDVDALFRHCDEQGAVHPHGQLAVWPHGMKEFTVLDDNGNCLRLGERVHP